MYMFPVLSFMISDHDRPPMHNAKVKKLHVDNRQLVFANLLRFQLSSFIILGLLLVTKDGVSGQKPMVSKYTIFVEDALDCVSQLMLDLTVLSSVGFDIYVRCRCLGMV